MTRARVSGDARACSRRRIVGLSGGALAARRTDRSADRGRERLDTGAGAGGVAEVRFEAESSLERDVEF